MVIKTMAHHQSVVESHLVRLQRKGDCQHAHLQWTEEIQEDYQQLM